MHYYYRRRYHREREMENYLIPGFRFFPTEEELVSFYLHNKLEDGGHDLKQVMEQIIPNLDIYNFNPWDLPQYAGKVCRRDQEQWFFFMPRQDSVARGGRPKRLTTTGYWKATGTSSHVYSSNNRSIGVKRTMVFYNGRAPNGSKTEWKMNEYKAIHDINGDHHPSSPPSDATSPQLREEFSLCRIYKKSKTLRSFDRRPQPREPEMAQSAAHDAQAATTEPLWFIDEPNATSNAPLTATVSSLDSSSSGDRHDKSSPTTNNELNIEAMKAAYEPLWDWEQLNWF